MAIITRATNYFKPLENFLIKHTTADVNRETYLICHLDDVVNKIKVSIVFLKRCENIECGSFESCIIEREGAVFTVPCYWVDIPNELSLTYLTSIIDTFYADHVASWLNGTWVGSSSTGGGSNNAGDICECPCMT